MIDAVLVNADAETNPAPSGTTTSMSPSATSGGDNDNDDAQSSTPAMTSSPPANFAGKVSVDFGNLGLGGVVVALGAIMGGGLVAL